MFKDGTVKKAVVSLMNYEKESVEIAKNLKLSITSSNRKIGRVLNVSLPPVLTCGNCGQCKKYCYDIKAVLQYPNTVVRARMRNYMLLKANRDEYFRLYEITARAIKDVDPAIPVGGPSTSGSKWVKSFLQFCRENDVPVDFVTTHQYSGDPLSGVEDQGDPLAEGEGHAGFDVKTFLANAGKRLQNATGTSMLEGLRAVMGDQTEEQDVPNNGFSRNSAIVRQQAGDVPLYYTEWNENAGFSSFTNDTRKVAAYDVKAALDVMDNMDGSSIWCFSDIFEEFHPFPEEFHGGFGMLTQNGIPKPVYYAMKMLADAGEQRLVLDRDATWGEIGIGAFKAPGETQVLLDKNLQNDLSQEYGYWETVFQKVEKGHEAQELEEDEPEIGSFGSTF